MKQETKGNGQKHWEAATDTKIKMGSISFHFFYRMLANIYPCSLVIHIVFFILWFVNDHVHAQMFLTFINISMPEHRFLTHILHGCILNTEHNIHLQCHFHVAQIYLEHWFYTNRAYPHKQKAQQQICNHHGGSRWPLAAGAWCFGHGGMAMRF